jgi:release factor glutamine methyltransferase
MIKHISAIHQGVSINIEYDEHVYQPGPLTSTLCDIMEVKQGDRVIDVGCGTGYIGIIASLLGASEIIGIDPVPEALKWTQHNARLNNISNLTVKLGGALDPVTYEEADLILSLPPQMPYPTNFNPWRYGGPDGTDVIMRIIRQARSILNKKGARLYLIHTALANPAKIRNSLSASGFRWEIVKTVEKEFDRADLDSLAPGLTDYLLKLMHRGTAEIVERSGRHYYPVWFYSAELL